jgi:hypothetical protein
VQFLVACASVCVCVVVRRIMGLLFCQEIIGNVESVTRCCAVHGGGLVTCALEFGLLGTNRRK